MDLPSSLNPGYYVFYNGEPWSDYANGNHDYGIDGKTRRATPDDFKYFGVDYPIDLLGKGDVTMKDKWTSIILH